jgi:acyl carrier protein
LFVVFGALIAIYAMWEKRSKGKRVEAAFAGRDRLTADEICSREFRDEPVSAEVIDRVRNVLERELEADLSRMRTTDDFSKNLSFFWDYDSLAAVTVFQSLEEEFNVVIRDEEAEKMLTFRDMRRSVKSASRSPKSLS